MGLYVVADVGSFPGLGIIMVNLFSSVCKVNYSRYGVE